MNGVFELQMKPGEPFRLGLFTDLHFDGIGLVGALRARRHVRRNGCRLRLNMLAVLGDTALCPYNRGRTRRFTQLMHSLHLPWTVVLGNHEGERENEVQRRNVVEMYGRSERFLGNVELPGVTGHGNQAIAVINPAGRAVQLLYFLDSGGGRRGHGYIQPDQLGWLSRVAQRYPGVPGMIFMHVPAWHYQKAYEALQCGEAQLLHGNWRERICTGGTQEQCEALLARAREIGVWAFVSGHDHSNNFDILWQGMRYIYAQSGGYSRICYDKRSRGVRGCTVFAIWPEGKVDMEQNFN